MKRSLQSSYYCRLREPKPQEAKKKQAGIMFPFFFHWRQVLKLRPEVLCLGPTPAIR